MSVVNPRFHRVASRAGLFAVLAIVLTLVVGRLAVALLPWPDGSFADLGLAAATVFLAPVAGLVAALVVGSEYRHRRLPVGDRRWLSTAMAVVVSGTAAAVAVTNWPTAFVVMVVGATGLVVLRIALIERSS